MQRSSDAVTPASVIARLGGTAHTVDILASGVHPRQLYAARDDGTLVEVSRGVFRLAELPLTEPDLVVVATRMPRAVLCCITALHLHGLTQEIPRGVHVSLPRGVHPARLPSPPLEVYHVTDDCLVVGVSERLIDGLSMKVTSPARAVADMFKFRSRVSLESALDALRKTLAEGAATPAEIDEMAALCRVQRVLRPYLEALA